MKAFRGGLYFPQALHVAKNTALQIPLCVFTPKKLRLSLKVGNSVLHPVVADRSHVRVGELVAVDPAKNVPPLHSGLSGEVCYETDGVRTDDEATVTALSVVGDGQTLPDSLLPRLPEDSDAAAIVQLSLIHI